MGPEGEKSNHNLSFNILLKDFEETIQTRDGKYIALIPEIKSVRKKQKQSQKAFAFTTWCKRDLKA